MPEAEELITDAARHAAVFARDLWRRHRGEAVVPGTVALRDVAQRLELLLAAALGGAWRLRMAQPPAPATFLTRVLRRAEGPRTELVLPATDGTALWLPAQLTGDASLEALARYRLLALQQALRAQRQAPTHFWQTLREPRERAAFLVLEAQAVDAELLQRLPGLRPALAALRAQALAQRPALGTFPAWRQPLERLVRELLAQPPSALEPLAPAQVLDRARQHAEALPPPAGRRLLWRDLWTGELRAPSGAPLAGPEGPGEAAGDDPDGVPRSARLPRAPEVRAAPEDEDDARPGAWMVQTSQPHEQAEDPMGLQRPVDRDDATAAEELADAVSELPEARLVSTPGRPREVLLSEEPPLGRARQGVDAAPTGEGAVLHYPEWDHRRRAYRLPGATVHLKPAALGDAAWVARTLAAHGTLAHQVQRRFEMLRAQPQRLRRQLDGEEPDLDAIVEAHADLRAGLPMSQGLYQTWRRARRDLALVLLVDVSGSTDAWVTPGRRVIDVEREALLLVSLALQGLAAPAAIQAFSGVGPQGVVVRELKGFQEPFGETVSRRIAALEPEHYTRTGAALRHATAVLMRQGARHRLLLLLSDGKPNDVDAYDGAYGVEDLRQAVVEARLQGVSPFCLTIDRQAASYLPGVFGAGHYALLPRPERLPAVLPEWLRRLVQG